MMLRGKRSMRITELLDRNSINLQAAPKDKNEAIEMAIDLVDAAGKLNDKDEFRKLVYAREEESTTGVGEGIAIPHGKGDCVGTPGLSAMIIKEGVDYESLDRNPVNILFLIAAPETDDNIHLEMLAQLSMMLMDDDFRKNLLAAKDVDEFLAVIDAADDGKKSTDEGKSRTDILADKKRGKLKVVAVSACPTGIAHTYMAAEGLEKAAQRAGIEIKVETRGASGTKNELTDEEIEAADYVVLITDTKVPMERFNGKRMIQRRVSDGISKADEIMNEVKKGNAPIFVSKTGSRYMSSIAEIETSEHIITSADMGKTGHLVYTWLMSGVSRMLPFVIGGGILTALAFLIDTIAGYGATGGSNFGSITPLAAMFKYIGGLSLGLMVPVLAGYIAYAIADRPGLAVGFVGGILAANGNAIIDNFTFSEGVLIDGKEMGAFSQFISQFAFEQPAVGTTVSGFLGGIAAGFMAGFIVLGLKKLCSRFPSSMDGIKPTLIYPLIGILVEGLGMCFIMNPIIGFINTELANLRMAISEAGMLTILGLILGAMMAIDMGGPINKAAYVFGTGMLANAARYMEEGMIADDPKIIACYIAMASIMVGGMVPPVGVALACWIFPKKFTKAERSSAVSNVILGASFITEGAIPVAAADPLHVIPCTMAGAGVAGCLAALFKCTLMAPHGGLFVFATVGNPLLYIVSWLVGSGVTCVMLGIFKKTVEQR